MRHRIVSGRSEEEAFRAFKELDAFPKVPASYKSTSATGAGLSILTFILIVILTVSEVRYYSATELKFDYSVDTNLTAKLKINIDLTVAMKCQHIGADVLDQTGQDTYSFGKLDLIPVHFELSPAQRQHMDFIQNVNKYLREEYHAIHELLWSTNIPTFSNGMPEREDNPQTPHDGCRVHGSLEVNKVAGNFHITAGKSIPVIPRGHAHLAMMVGENDYNFSHRIDHFSYGEPVSGVINPLDGQELIIKDSHYHMFQYFVQIVPTEVRTYSANVDTFQYAVSEQNRSISHSKGSHGVPGIFVKYDLYSLKVRVTEEHLPYWQFLVRMCGIIGGIFSVSGMLNSMLGFLTDIICCRFKMGRYKSAPGATSVKTVQYQNLNSEPNTQDVIPTISLLAQENAIAQQYSEK